MSKPLLLSLDLTERVKARLRSSGWIIDCCSRFTALRGRRLIFSHVIRSAGSPDASLKQAANYFPMPLITAHFKARKSGQDRSSGGLITSNRHGLSAGKNGPEAFDKANFLISLDPFFKSDLQILSLAPSKDWQGPAGRLSDLSSHFIFTWNTSTCSMAMHIPPTVQGGAWTFSLKKT